MNKAQKNLKVLISAAVLEKEKEFLQKCYEAWEGYEDSNYSYPAWQLKAISEKYGMTTNEIKLKYKINLNNYVQ